MEMQPPSTVETIQKVVTLCGWKGFEIVISSGPYVHYLFTF